MNVLLDTHVLLWWLSNDSALPRSAAARIEAAENTIFVSAVTYWEIWLKKSIGKLKIPANFSRIAADQGFEDLPLTAAHARAVADLPWLHRDPFDRILIAQARVEKLRLLTADASLAAYGPMVITTR